MTVRDIDDKGNTIMPRFGNPNSDFLDRYTHSERDPLRYGIEALLWLHVVCESKDGAKPWTKSVDANFLHSVESVLEYFDKHSGVTIRDATRAVIRDVANWRNNIKGKDVFRSLNTYIDDSKSGRATHAFDLTEDTVLEGITSEYVMEAWDYDDENKCIVLLALATLILSDVAIAAYWADKAQGRNLSTELGRLFSREDNANSFIGQMANLTAAGYASSWGARVTFLTETGAPTPDFLIEDDLAKVWVEATSCSRACSPSERASSLANAIFAAWNEKIVKFKAGAFSPGMIVVDHSGLLVDDRLGTQFNLAYRGSCRMRSPNNEDRSLMFYRYRDDTKMQQRQKATQGLLGLLSDLLRSPAATERGIKGIGALQVQQVSYDGPGRKFLRPRRSCLAWSGEVTDPEFGLAFSVCHPAICESDRIFQPVTFPVYLV